MVDVPCLIELHPHRCIIAEYNETDTHTAVAHAQFGDHVFEEVQDILKVPILVLFSHGG